MKVVHVETRPGSLYTGLPFADHIRHRISRHAPEEPPSAYLKPTMKEKRKAWEKFALKQKKRKKERKERK